MDGQSGNSTIRTPQVPKDDAHVAILRSQVTISKNWIHARKFGYPQAVLSLNALFGQGSDSSIRWTHIPYRNQKITQKNNKRKRFWYCGGSSSCHTGSLNNCKDLQEVMKNGRTYVVEIPAPNKSAIRVFIRPTASKKHPRVSITTQRW